MPSSDSKAAVARAYDGSSITFRVLRAFGWGPFLNLGYYPFGGRLAALNFVFTGTLLLPYFRLPAAQMALVRGVLRLARPQPHERLLDLGCGRGASSFLAAASRRAALVVGLDVLRANVESASVLYHGVPGLCFGAADATQLPLRSGCFEVAVCIEAAFHFADRPQFLRELARTLRPRGRVVLVDFMWRNADSAERAGATNVDYVRRTWGWQSFESTDSYTSQLRGAGFVVDAVHDWSPHVTAPLAVAMRTVALLGSTAAGQRLLQVYNPLLRSLEPADWAEFAQSTRAHTAVHRESAYIALTAHLG